MKEIKMKIVRKRDYYVIKRKKLFWWQEMKAVTGYTTCHRGIVPLEKDLHFSTEEAAKKFLKEHPKVRDFYGDERGVRLEK